MNDKMSAIYMRLSKDDGRTSESESIENQRKILVSFCSENGYKIYSEYVDDGYSGTSIYTRPAFMKMLHDIESGKIDTVIAKDLSRIGRNIGEVSMLLDSFFTKHRIRFISVTENIDSQKRDMNFNIVTPMHNFANELYSADISNKIRSVLSAKIKNGEYIGSFAPYGYKKDNKNKNHLIIDIPAAKTVKRIFSLASSGVSPSHIADILNKEHILTPYSYRYGKEGNIWHGGNVGKILRNKTYLGHTIQGKTCKPSFKSSYSYLKPESEWIIIENTHEPIIDENTWQAVRNILHSRRQKRTKGFRNIFSSIAFCGECGKGMSTTSSKKAGSSANLICGAYKSGGKSLCTSHSICYELLCDIVLNTLKEIFTLSKEEKEKIVLDTIHSFQSESENDLKKQLKLAEKKIERLFDDKYSGIIDQQSFKELLQKYNANKKQLFEKINSCDNYDKKYQKAYETLEKICSEPLCEDVLFMSVEKIKIHHDLSDNSRRTIDIFLAFSSPKKSAVENKHRI